MGSSSVVGMGSGWTTAAAAASAIKYLLGSMAAVESQPVLRGMKRASREAFRVGRKGDFYALLRVGCTLSDRPTRSILFSL